MMMSQAKEINGNPFACLIQGEERMKRWDEGKRCECARSLMVFGWQSFDLEIWMIRSKIQRLICLFLYDFSNFPPEVSHKVHLWSRRIGCAGLHWPFCAHYFVSQPSTTMLTIRPIGHCCCSRVKTRDITFYCPLFTNRPSRKSSIVYFERVLCLPLLGYHCDDSFLLSTPINLRNNLIRLIRLILVLFLPLFCVNHCLGLFPPLPSLSSSPLPFLSLVFSKQNKKELLCFVLLWICFLHLLSLRKVLLLILLL